MTLATLNSELYDFLKTLMTLNNFDESDDFDDLSYWGWNKFNIQIN